LAFQPVWQRQHRKVYAGRLVNYEHHHFDGIGFSPTPAARTGRLLTAASKGLAYFEFAPADVFWPLAKDETVVF